MNEWNNFFLKKDGNDDFGIILNTSFNLHGRTNVLRSEEAI